MNRQRSVNHLFMPPVESVRETARFQTARSSGRLLPQCVSQFTTRLATAIVTPALLLSMMTGEMLAGERVVEGTTEAQEQSSRSPSTLLNQPPLTPLASDLAPSLLAQVPNSMPLLTSFKHGNNVNTVAFSNSGNYLASAGGDRIIRIWHVDSVLAWDEDNLVHWALGIPDSDRYVTSLAFSPDDRYLVTGTFKGDVRVWDLQSCDPETKICPSSLLLERNYNSVAPVVRFSPNGQLLAASNYDGTVTLWDWSRRQVLAVLEPETGAHDGTRVDGRFSSLGFSPDSQYLAAGSHDTTITVWHLADFELMGTVETRYGVESVAFAHNGTLEDGIVLVSGNLNGIEVRSLEVRRDRLRLDEDETLELEGNGRVNTLLFDPGDRFIFGGDNNNNIMVWDLEEEESLPLIPVNQQHQQPILSIAMNPMRRMLATSSTDGTIKLWQP
ncbi:MAG: WD40 repeat domain-containing protein [Leptolyngbyaceae cyanobacterium]